MWWLEGSSVEPIVMVPGQWAFDRQVDMMLPFDGDDMVQLGRDRPAPDAGRVGTAFQGLADWRMITTSPNGWAVAEA